MHFRDQLPGGAWRERTGGTRANASKTSHAEHDAAPSSAPATGGNGAAPEISHVCGAEHATEAPTLRRATPGDAADLARSVDLRAARDEGAFSWRNAVIAELGGAVAGGGVAYRGSARTPRLSTTSRRSSGRVLGLPPVPAYIVARTTRNRREAPRCCSIS